MFIVPITFCSWATRGERGRGVDDQAGVDDGVDLGRVDDPPQQRVVRADADVLGAVQLARRVLGRDADDRLDGVVLFEHLGQPAAPVAGEAGDQDSHPSHTESRVGDHLVQLLLDPAADLLGHGLHEALVLVRVLAPLVGRDRLQEADLELRGQVAEAAEQAEQRERRRDREVDEAGELAGEADVAEDRHRLLGADDGDGDDRGLAPSSRTRRSRRGRIVAAGSGPCRASRSPCGPRGRRARVAPRRGAGGARWPGARGRRRACRRAC